MAIQRRKLQVLTAFAAVAALFGCGGSDDSPPSASNPGTSSPPSTSTPSSDVFRVAGLVYSAPVVANDASGSQVVQASVMTQSGTQTLTVPAASAEAVAAIKAALVPGNLVDWIPGTASNIAAVPKDSAAAVNVILAKGSSSAAQFNLAKYGPSVSRYMDKPGPMVAAGWVYGKTPGTITVGDGNMVLADMAGRPYSAPIKRYEETYNLASNVQVYNVNTADYSKSTISDYSSIPVTADYYYGTTSRQAAYLLFDNNYLNSGAAKVVAIWYFTPKSTTDGKPVWEVPTQSPLLASKGNDPVSGQPFVAINATTPTTAPYTRSTEPFEIVKNTMYYVGDNEVASYVLKADMGTPNDTSDDKIIKVDAGWPNSGYQYWKNMELLGLDPRSVTDIWLTHGHGDHYGTIVEQLKMMDTAGKPINLWGSREDVVGITKDGQGNTWNIAGALPASETVIRARTANFYEYDKWYDFGNVQVMVIWSPGHTPGTTNMIFRVKNPTDGKFYTFGYHGGYGVNGLEKPTATNGWLRLDFQHGFSYLQNMVDVDFVSPQHTNQYPIVEVYQAMKAYNRDPANASKQLTMMEALTSRVADSPKVNGVGIMSEFENQLEKRRSVISYKASDTANPNYRSLETSGPFKPGRESGLTGVQATILDGGRIIQGFTAAQNKNPSVPLLANGVSSASDTFTNDPSGFYVQVYIDVKDSVYKGYLPQGLSQFSPSLGTTV